MKNKKGFLLGEHTLKVVIAVLCLLLLFYLLFSLYSNSQDERNLQLAGATLGELVEKMEEAKVEGESEAIILNPSPDSFLEKAFQEEWWIIAWPYKGEGTKPTQCQRDYCVCICVIPSNYESFLNLFNIRKKSLEECNSLGICKSFDEKIEVINKPIPIKDPPINLDIKYGDKEGFEISKK